jgi:hypothetical protein
MVDELGLCATYGFVLNERPGCALDVHRNAAMTLHKEKARPLQYD